MMCESILQLVGRTPHVRIRNTEQEATTTYLKLEGFNPTGSIKDRSCVYMLQDLIRSGKLQPSMVLLDASSGNMACAIAFYGALLGFRSTVVVNSKLTREKRDFLHYYGATLYQIGNFTIEGNRFCREMIAEGAQDQYYFLDQLHNWTNPKAHEETTGPEILTDFPDVAMVVGSLGSGGSLLGNGSVPEGAAAPDEDCGGRIGTRDALARNRELRRRRLRDAVYRGGVPLRAFRLQSRNPRSRCDPAHARVAQLGVLLRPTNRRSGPGGDDRNSPAPD